MSSKPTLLWINNGFGLSTSWLGNAISAANPINFNRIWNEYEHYPLSPFSSTDQFQKVKLNPYLNLNSVINGREAVSDKELIDRKFENKLLGQNEKLTQMFSQLEKHNSSLHLIGNVSKNQEFGSAGHLVNLVKIAKANRIFNINIHLIIDKTHTDKKELQKNLSALDNQLAEIGVGEVVSITGEKSLTDNKLTAELFNVLYFGQGKSCLSSSQAINFANQTPADLAPICIRKSNIKKISDFDVLFFFNHNPLNIQSLIENLSLQVSRRTFSRYPKYTYFVSLVEFPSMIAKDIHFIHQSNQESLLSETLINQHRNCALISTQDGILKSKFYLKADTFDLHAIGNGQNDSEKIFNNTEQIINNSIKSLIDKKADFVIAYTDIFEKIALKNDFKMVKDAATLIDKMLGRAEKFVLKYDFNLIFLSTYGMAEKFVLDSQNNETKITINPVPFIKISSDSKITDDKHKNKTSFINDLIKTPRPLAFANQFLIKYLGADNN